MGRQRREQGHLNTLGDNCPEKSRTHLEHAQGIAVREGNGLEKAVELLLKFAQLAKVESSANDR